MVNRKSQQETVPDFTPKGVDRAVNAALSAMTRDLGRPFMAGGRNVRSVIRQWCPLRMATVDMDVDTFQRNYITAHYLDRFLYSEEVRDSGVLEAEALDKFKANLSRGLIQNSWRLQFLEHGRLNTVLKSASLEIQHILGELEVEEWFSLCAHGPNSTLGVRKDDAYADKKALALDGTLPVIHLHKQYLAWNTTLGAYLEPMLRGKHTQYEVVPGNKLSFVPKKFNSLRTMMIEPTLNQFFQQGLGNLIAARLKAFGNVDLSNQPTVHRLLTTVITSNELDIATVDWSQASDRIWLGLCQKLLPSDWFAALCDVRSEVTTYGGEQLHLTMAGSMGAGFTFPLQSLIFLTVLRALARESGRPQFVSVFGDDCICDSDLLPEIQWFADAVDWQMNADKSFASGPFRESCGVDSYRGVDCRPFFIERPDALDRATLEAWAYGVYNQTVAAMPPTVVPTHMADWLTEFLRSFDSEPRIKIVPPRFSVNSGVQWNLATPLPFCTHLVDFPLRDYYYPYSGWHFSYIGTARGQRAVDQEPYYIMALEGKGVPRGFKDYVIDPEESSDVSWPSPQGTVSSKKARYIVRTGFVHSWVYLVD